MNRISRLISMMHQSLMTVFAMLIFSMLMGACGGQSNPTNPTDKDKDKIIEPEPEPDPEELPVSNTKLNLVVQGRLAGTNCSWQKGELEKRLIHVLKVKKDDLENRCIIQEATSRSMVSLLPAETSAACSTSDNKTTLQLETYESGKDGSLLETRYEVTLDTQWRQKIILRVVYPDKPGDFAGLDGCWMAWDIPMSGS